MFGNVLFDGFRADSKLHCNSTFRASSAGAHAAGAPRCTGGTAATPISDMTPNTAVPAFMTPENDGKYAPPPMVVSSGWSRHLGFAEDRCIGRLVAVDANTGDHDNARDIASTDTRCNTSERSAPTA